MQHQLHHRHTILVPRQQQLSSPGDFHPHSTHLKPATSQPKASQSPPKSSTVSPTSTAATRTSRFNPPRPFADALTAYNSTSNTWALGIVGFGGDYASRFLTLTNQTNFSKLSNVTYNTLRDWMYQGWQRYEDSLQTNWPDVTKFHASGGKILHYHGESDNSIPPASSVRYYESVRNVMYGSNMDYKTRAGEVQGLCSWPLRAYRRNIGTSMECQYDQASIDTWLYDLDAFNMPVY